MTQSSLIVDRYLEGSYDGTRGSDKNGSSSTSNGSEAPTKPPRGKKSLSQDGLELGPPRKKKQASEMEVDESAQRLSAAIKAAVSGCIDSKLLPEDLELPQVSVRKVTENTRGKLKATIEGRLEYTSSIAFAIAAAMNRKRKKSKGLVEVVDEVNRPFQECSPCVVAELLVSQLRDDTASGHIPHACKGHLNFLTVGCRLEGLDHSPPSSGRDPLLVSSLSTTEGNYFFDDCIIV